MLKTFNQIKKEIHDISGISNPTQYLYKSNPDNGVYYPVKRIDTFIKGNEYSLTDIANFADQYYYTLNQYGKNRMGENFILLTHSDNDFVISFIYTGVLYECIYNDFN